MCNILEDKKERARIITLALSCRPNLLARKFALCVESLAYAHLPIRASVGRSEDWPPLLSETLDMFYPFVYDKISGCY